MQLSTTFIRRASRIRTATASVICRGIISKLDYIKSLGVTALWLNPIYVSPFKDAGYDVADYYQVAPRYGTNDDLKELLSAAHAQGLKVILDFVPGHTSDEHPWFLESAKPEKNPYSNRYIWNEGTFAGRKSDPAYVYGMHQRDGGYRMNFFNFQPALNYGFYNIDNAFQQPTDHSDVLATREEMNNVIRFWLDMGIDGFRVDMAASLVKNDHYGCGIREYWQSVRKWWYEKYSDRVLISEWSSPRDAIDAGFHIDFMIHSGTATYNSLFRLENGSFSRPLNGNSYFRTAGKGDVLRFVNDYLDQLRCIGNRGFVSIPTGNHDFHRISTFRNIDELKVAYTFLFTLAGVPTLYYGDEIGMRNLDNLPSREGAYERTGARTPMQWDRQQPNAGFSQAATKDIYLPVDDSMDAPDVASQSGDADSLLEFTRKLITLRRSRPELGNTGEIRFIHAERNKYPLIYLRRKGESCSMVVVNPADQEFSLTLENDPGCRNELINSGVEFRNGKIHVPPVSYAIFSNECGIEI